MRTSPPASAPLRPGPAQAYSLHRQETRGLALGLLGVAIFALTLPMTRLAVVLPVMVLFAFTSNLVYAATGALLRQWLAQGSRLLWFNRGMALVLVLTAAWMATA